MASKYFDSETTETSCYLTGIENHLVSVGFTRRKHGHWLAQLDNAICSISWDGIRRDTVKVNLHKSFHEKSMADVEREIESTGYFEDHFSRELVLIVPDKMKRYFHPSKNVGHENTAIGHIIESLETYGFPILSIPTLEKLLAYKEGVDKLAESDSAAIDYSEALLDLVSEYSTDDFTFPPRR